MLHPGAKWGLAAMALAWAGAASAAPVNGTLNVGGASVTPDPGPLTSATSIGSLDSGYFAMGSGSFLNLTDGSNTNLTQLLTFSPSPINVPLSGTASSNMTITGSGAAAGFGTFETTSVEVIARTTGFLDLYFLGTYNPDFGPSGGGTYAQDEAASFRLNVTRNSSVDGSTSTDFVGVLAAPPSGTPVPEPVSMAVLGAGLLGLGLGRRRRSNISSGAVNTEASRHS